MRLKNFRKPLAVILIALIFSSCKKNPRCHDDNNPYVSMKVFATGLNNPRGLEFGPDGNLYVAEGGLGGTNSTAGQCDQIGAPAGPYTGSLTGGRISKINPWGSRTTVTDQLPSAQGGGDIVGVADVAFIGHTLYGLLAAGGCSHGNPSVPNGVVKVAQDGSWSLVADLSAWVKTHPAKYPEQGPTFDPDGGFYSMDNAHGDLYVIEPNHGQMIKVTPGGDISEVIDISASQGHIVPTSIAAHNGNFFVGNLNTFPIQIGSSKVYKITPSGDISVWASGFTTILGVTFDKEGRLYVLENTTSNLFPTPGTGKVIRVDQWGNKETLVTGLNLPTAFTFGPDGKLYISNKGFGPEATGGGEVVRVNLKNCDWEDLPVAPVK